MNGWVLKGANFYGPGRIIHLSTSLNVIHDFIGSCVSFMITFINKFFSARSVTLPVRSIH